MTDTARSEDTRRQAERSEARCSHVDHSKCALQR
jgi:hypothetical protein